MNYPDVTVLEGDCIESMRILPDESVHCCVTSPPYWGLRDYGVDGQLGLEPTPEEYTEKMVAVFTEVWRVLRKDGTVWLNLGDSYTANGDRSGNNGFKDKRNNRDKRCNAPTPVGLKPKNLVGIPWRVAFALQSFGWYLRQDIIWAKPNPMPESVKDRCTKSHEYIFLLSKSARYYYDADAICQHPKQSLIDRLSQSNLENQRGSNRVPGKTNGRMKAVFGGRNKHAGYNTRIHSGREDAGNYLKRGVNRRSVWTVSTRPYSEAHFAVFPPKLIEPCILVGCPVSGTVLDPFSGSGTTGEVALKYGRKYVGCELNPEYIKLTEKRLSNLQTCLTF